MTHKGPFQPLPFCDSVISGGDTAGQLTPADQRDAPHRLTPAQQ